MEKIYQQSNFKQQERYSLYLAKYDAASRRGYIFRANLRTLICRKT